MSICRYLDINSAYRNRSMFPNPFEFQVTYTNLANQTRSDQITDGISKTIAYRPDITTRNVGDPARDQILATSAQNVAGSYIGQYFYLIDFTTQNVLQPYYIIINYDSTTNTITVDRDLPNVSILTQYYYFFRDEPLATNSSTYDLDVCSRTPLSITNQQILGPSASLIPDSYIGDYFYLIDFTTDVVISKNLVIGYNAGTTTITVQGTIPNPSVLTNYFYYFGKTLSSNTSFIIDVGRSTTSTIVINEFFSDTTQFNGKWLQICQFTPDDLIIEPKKIVNTISVPQTGSTPPLTTFYLTPSSPLAYFPDTFLSASPSILGISGFINNVINNEQPLVYTGTTVGTQVPRCYNLDLCDMIISNSQIVYGHPGGAVSTYPYIYLEIQAESQKTKNILISNNPNSTNALFKIPTSSDMITSFINLRSCTSQTIKFKPNDAFSFRFLRPDGEVLRWQDPDTLAPYPPNQSLQISFTIRFCPVNCVEDV